MSKYIIRWKNYRPYCWEASVDGGNSWEDLNADNDEDSSEAIEEAFLKYGVPTYKWDIED